MSTTNSICAVLPKKVPAYCHGNAWLGKRKHFESCQGQSLWYEVDSELFGTYRKCIKPAQSICGTPSCFWLPSISLACMIGAALLLYPHTQRPSKVSLYYARWSINRTGAPRLHSAAYVFKSWTNQQLRISACEFAFDLQLYRRRFGYAVTHIESRRHAHRSEGRHRSTLGQQPSVMDLSFGCRWQTQKQKRFSSTSTLRGMLFRPTRVNKSCSPKWSVQGFWYPLRKISAKYWVADESYGLFTLRKTPKQRII